MCDCAHGKRVVCCKTVRYTSTNLSGKGRLESFLASGVDVDEANICGAPIFGVVAALVVLALVRVALLCVDSAVLLDILESVVHEAAVAALVAVGAAAVDEILLAEADQLPGLPEVHSLQGARRGEGPTGAALALVLHLGDGAILSPVHVVGQARHMGGRHVLSAHPLLHGVVAGPHAVTVQFLDKLVVEHVPVLVHLEVEAVVTLGGPPVVLLHLGLVLHVDLHAELLLCGGLIALLVGQLPGLPLLHHQLEERDGPHGRQQPQQHQQHTHSRHGSLPLNKASKLSPLGSREGAGRRGEGQMGHKHPQKPCNAIAAGLGGAWGGGS
jgi:hypothetical protein